MNFAFIVDCVTNINTDEIAAGVEAFRELVPGMTLDDVAAIARHITEERRAANMQR